MRIWNQFNSRTKVANSESKVTKEAQVSTQTETPVSTRSDPLASNRSNASDVPSTDHRIDAANLAKKDYFSDFIRTESDTEMKEKGCKHSRLPLTITSTRYRARNCLST